MPDLGTWVTSGTSGHAQYKSVKCIFVVRSFVFKPPFAARKANETKIWPHLEAVAVFGKWVRYSNSAVNLEGKMFNKPCWSISFIKNVFFLKSA